MQRERIGRCVWYGTAQRIRIGGGSANVLWLQIGGAFAVICACHVEQGCIDEAFHRARGGALQIWAALCMAWGMAETLLPRSKTTPRVQRGIVVGNG